MHGGEFVQRNARLVKRMTQANFSKDNTDTQMNEEAAHLSAECEQALAQLAELDAANELLADESRACGEEGGAALQEALSERAAAADALAHAEAELQGARERLELRQSLLQWRQRRLRSGFAALRAAAARRTQRDDRHGVDVVLELTSDSPTVVLS